MSQYRGPGFQLGSGILGADPGLPERNRDYKVTIQVTGRWGPTMGYKDGVTPAVLEAQNGDTLTVEDEAEKWDIIAG